MMIQRFYRQAVSGLALAALLAGCGGGSGPSAVQAPTLTQNVSKAAGAALSTPKTLLNIPANALSQDSLIAVTDDPNDLPSAAKTAALIASVKIAATGGATIASGTPLTLTLPDSRANQYPVYVYKVDGSVFTEIFATPLVSNSAPRSQSYFPVTLFGTYAIYNASLGTLPATPQPVVVGIAPLENAALYGAVRLRVNNLFREQRSGAGAYSGGAAAEHVSVSIGGITARATYANFTGESLQGFTGGAVDFAVPYGLSAGPQPLVLTVSGVSSPPFMVHISNTHPFAVLNFGLTRAVAELRQDKAPLTVANFVGLATGKKTWIPKYLSGAALKTAGIASNQPLYDYKTFFRAAPGFARIGDPITDLVSPPSDWTAGNGFGGFTIPFEDTGLRNVAGSLAMWHFNSSLAGDAPTPTASTPAARKSSSINRTIPLLMSFATAAARLRAAMPSSGRS